MDSQAELLTMTAAARLLDGRRPGQGGDVGVLWRWKIRGWLETTKVRGKVYTTAPWVRECMARRALADPVLKVLVQKALARD